MEEDKGPVEPEIEGGGCSWWWVCGECHGPLKFGEKICPFCRRELKWDE